MVLTGKLLNAIGLPNYYDGTLTQLYEISNIMNNLSKKNQENFSNYQFAYKAFIKELTRNCLNETDGILLCLFLFLILILIYYFKKYHHQT